MRRRIDVTDRQRLAIERSAKSGLASGTSRCARVAVLPYPAKLRFLAHSNHDETKSVLFHYTDVRRIIDLR